MTPPRVGIFRTSQPCIIAPAVRNLAAPSSDTLRICLAGHTIAEPSSSLSAETPTPPTPHYHHCYSTFEIRQIWPYKHELHVKMPSAISGQCPDKEQGAGRVQSAFGGEKQQNQNTLEHTTVYYIYIYTDISHHIVIYYIV